MSKVIPQRVFTLVDNRAPRLLGVFSDRFEADALLNRFSQSYHLVRPAWGILEDTAQTPRVFLLPEGSAPEAVTLNVVLEDEKKAIRQRALAKLTPEEILVLGVKE